MLRKRRVRFWMNPSTKDRSGEEICYQKDTAQDRPEAEVEEEEETDLRRPGHRTSSQSMGDF